MVGLVLKDIGKRYLSTFFMYFIYLFYIESNYILGNETC